MVELKIRNWPMSSPDFSTCSESMWRVSQPMQSALRNETPAGNRGASHYTIVVINVYKRFLFFFKKRVF